MKWNKLFWLFCCEISRLIVLIDYSSVNILTSYKVLLIRLTMTFLLVLFTPTETCQCLLLKRLILLWLLLWTQMTREEVKESEAVAMRVCVFPQSSLICLESSQSQAVIQLVRHPATASAPRILSPLSHRRLNVWERCVITTNGA